MSIADPIALPTFAQIRGWDTKYLEAAADTLTAHAHAWESAYGAVLREVSQPGGTPWQGAAAEAAARRVAADRRTVLGAVDLLNDAAAVARSGATDIRIARQVVLDTISATRRAGFGVEDDLSIVDTTPAPSALRSRRDADAVTHARSVWRAADTLVVTDRKVARSLADATRGLESLRFPVAPAQDGPDALLASYAGSLPPLPAAPHLIYCYPSARPDFWWCEGYDIGGGPYGFDSPIDVSGVG